jgi:hypothetical protein
MKRTMIAALVLASAAFAQETKGPITMSKDGDTAHTVVKVSSVTPGSNLVFAVAVTYQLPASGPMVQTNRVAVQTVIRQFGTIKDPPPANLLIFDIPLAEVVSVSVSQYVLDEEVIFNN